MKKVKFLSQVDGAKCRGCERCEVVCPTGAMEVVQRQEVVCEGAVPASCSDACPASVDVPRYVRLIAEGKFAEAVSVIREKIPFPSVCGHVCVHPCEVRCQRDDLDEAISIRALKRFAGENDAGLWKGNSKVASATWKRVAIIGSGPAGLTAAYFLAKLGHSVTVFEALPEPGGMMRFGIPDYRLPKDILDAEIGEIKATGVEVRTNTRVDSLEGLFKKGYDAVFLAIGAHQGIRMGVEGEDSPRMKEGVSFLREVSLGKKPKLGERVAVVGGGNAAVDSARTALRLGAKEVTIIYRRTRDQMPAYPEEIELAVAEGVKFEFLAAPSRVIDLGREVQLECMRMRMGNMDDNGRRSAEPVKGSEFRVGFDTVIVAIGQFPEIPEQFGLPIGQGGTIQVAPDTFATVRKGVFAGGDAITGPASVIEAIAAGRQGAISIDKYLGGSGRIDEVLVPREGWVSIPEASSEGGRPHIPMLPVIERVCGFAEVELGLGEEMAVGEARRCLSCDLKEARVDEKKCVACFKCVEVCPEDAIRIIPRAEPVVFGLDPEEVDQTKLMELCTKAHLLPQQFVCLCSATRVSEAAAAVLKGAKSLEEISLMTGARSGCTAYCVEPMLRLLRAHGVEIILPKSYQWYNIAPTLWDVPKKVEEKYPGYFFEDDRKAYRKMK